MITPFAAYLPAEALHGSGVLAVVVAGLVVARAAPLIVSSTTRLQGQAVWDVIAFVLQGIVFALIGLQLRQILAGLHGYRPVDLAWYAALGLRRSRTGRVLIAMRDNERGAQAFGVNLVRTRLVTFALAGFMAAAGLGEAGNMPDVEDIINPNGAAMDVAYLLRQIRLDLLLLFLHACGFRLETLGKILGMFGGIGLRLAGRHGGLPASRFEFVF